MNSKGVATETFLHEQDVYISGDCLYASDEWVEIYVVKHRSKWGDGQVLTDVTGRVERIKVADDGDIPRERVWNERLDIGDYDIVVDTSENGEFDDGEDCVTPDGFKVIISGDGSVRLGSKNVDEDYRWKVEKDSPDVVMLQIRLSIEDAEDLNITSFHLNASGDANDKRSIAQVIIADDRGGDGVYEHGRDVIWGTGTYNHDSGKLKISTDVTLEKGSATNVLVVYVMGKEHSNGKIFKVTLEKIEAMGLISGKNILFDNLPVSSVLVETYGSGDAIISDVLKEPVPVQDVQEPKKETNNQETKEAGTFSGIFSQKDMDDGVSKGPWVAPMWARVVLFFGMMLIALAVIWKIIKIIFGVFGIFFLKNKDKTDKDY